MRQKTRLRALIKKWRWLNSQYGCVLLSDGRYYAVKCAQMIRRYQAALSRCA